MQPCDFPLVLQQLAPRHVPEEQSLFKLQDSPLLVVPDEASSDEASLEQVLVEETQKRPECAVQITPPSTSQKHAAVFDVAPLVCVQSGAATHRQNRE